MIADSATLMATRMVTKRSAVISPLMDEPPTLRRRAFDSPGNEAIDIPQSRRQEAQRTGECRDGGDMADMRISDDRRLVARRVEPRRKTRRRCRDRPRCRRRRSASSEGGAPGGHVRDRLGRRPVGAAEDHLQRFIAQRQKIIRTGNADQAGKVTVGIEA